MSSLRALTVKAMVQQTAMIKTLTSAVNQGMTLATWVPMSGNLKIDEAPIYAIDRRFCSVFLFLT